jgi:hypothetical protein
MPNDWFIVRAGKEQGPFTSQQLKEMTVKPPQQRRRTPAAAPPRISGSLLDFILGPDVVSGFLIGTAGLASANSPLIPLAFFGVGISLRRIRSSGDNCPFGVVAFFGNKMEKVTRGEFAEAEALWINGGRSGEVPRHP